MKIPALLTLLLAAVLSALPTSPARAADVSFDVFYNSLGDQGDWYNTPEYGYVWQPAVASRNEQWRPYSDGYWAQTDDGWAWVSYENFGWAAYHYGRWTRLESTGWVWVPGYEWGPGWVSWRTNDDFVGWAPLPPKRERGGGGGEGNSLTVNYNTVESEDGYDSAVDQQYDIGPDNYCFVQTANFGAPVLAAVLLPPQRNIVIIENTVNVTHITYRRGPDYVVVHNYGPDFNFIRTRVDRPIQQLRIERSNNLDFLHHEGPSQHNPNVVRDGVFQIAAPNINHRQVNFNEVRPPTVKQDLRDVRVEHGWRNTGADPATVTRVREQFQEQAHNRATRPPGNEPARDQRAPANIPPQPTGTVPAQPPGFNRTDDDKRARQDAAQRERETREAGRTNGGRPTPGVEPERDTRRQPFVATPTPAQMNPEREPRQHEPRKTDAPVATPPTATPPRADSEREARQSERRQHQDAPAAATPQGTPRGPRPQERVEPTAPPARNNAAETEHAAQRQAEHERAQEQRQQVQQTQERAQEQRQQVQQTQERAHEQQQLHAQEQQAQQRQKEQTAPRQEPQAQPRQPEQVQRRPEPQAPQNQPAKTDDKKKRDGQPQPPQ